MDAAKSGAGTKVDLSGLAKEHKRSHDTTYMVSSGEVYVDVRDWADCYVRITLATSDSISLPADLYRKISGNGCITEDTAKVNALIVRYGNEEDSIVMPKYHNYRELVCELCRQFFDEGWVTGTGGSISIRYGNRIYMTPSGVQKERILPDELYVLDINGEVLHVPPRKPGGRVPKLSDCSPLFLHAFQQRQAGAVLHSHAVNCNLVTTFFDGKSEFKISHQEMIKGIAGYGYFDELIVPIIENTAHEHELADCLGATIAKYPRAVAVLVRRHGMYVWGKTWEEAKRHGECLHYLFDIAVEYRKLGMDFNSPAVTATETNIKKRKVEAVSNGHNNGHSAAKHVVFDIEGTTTPITFVHDTLFPYASKNCKNFLESTINTAQTKADVKALEEQAKLDAAEFSDCPKIKASGADHLSSVVEYVQWCIQKDRKVGALKQLQGRIWDKGYASKEIVSVVYDDVPTYFQHLNDSGVQISIYSSGSREAQRLLFKHSSHGDLRPYISCYFDTKIGQKRESDSYKEIFLSLGADSPSQILFYTDIIEEAEAAKDAGFQTCLVTRPGNKVLPKNTTFKQVNSFADV